MSLNEVQSATVRGWKPAQVYTMAGICVVIGLALGYLFRGSASNAVPASPVVQASGQGATTATAPAQMPSLDQMKQMADKQAAPLLAKLKSDPNNSNLLNQIGTVYKATHQFKQAIGFYQKAVQADPRNHLARTDLASCLYYEGDVDGALKQLQQALTNNPKDADSLFNLGMIRWKGKGDTNGATQAWTQLLQSNPQLDPPKKTQVEKLLAQVQGQKSTN
jgi:cytochrome c-type biogenesis protein CcmH/NrfG